MRTKCDRCDAVIAHQEVLKKDYAVCDAERDTLKLEVTSLRESLKFASETLHSAEAAIAVFGVTAYVKYNPKCPTLLEVKNAIEKLKSKHNL
jgi:hypothetical protein